MHIPDIEHIYGRLRLYRRQKALDCTELFVFFFDTSSILESSLLITTQETTRSSRPMYSLLGS